MIEESSKKYVVDKILKAPEIQELKADTEEPGGMDSAILEADVSYPYEEEILEKFIAESDVSPLKSVRVSQRNKLAYGKKKLVHIQGAVSDKVAKLLGVESNELPEMTTCSKCEDMDRLLLFERKYVNIIKTNAVVNTATGTTELDNRQNCNRVQC